MRKLLFLAVSVPMISWADVNSTVERDSDDFISDDSVSSSENKKTKSPFYAGFRVSGTYLGGHRADTTDSAGAAHDNYDATRSIGGYGGGVFSGYTFNHKTWTSSIELDLAKDMAVSSAKESTDALFNNVSRLYNFSLAWIPSFPVFSDDLKLNFLVGLNYARFKIQVIQRELPADDVIANKRKEGYGALGASAGVGIEKDQGTWSWGAMLKYTKYQNKTKWFNDGQPGASADSHAVSFHPHATELSLRIKVPI